MKDAVRDTRLSQKFHAYSYYISDHIRQVKEIAGYWKNRVFAVVDPKVDRPWERVKAERQLETRLAEEKAMRDWDVITGLVAWDIDAGMNMRCLPRDIETERTVLLALEARNVRHEKPSPNTKGPRYIVVPVTVPYRNEGNMTFKCKVLARYMTGKEAPAPAAN